MKIKFTCYIFLTILLLGVSSGHSQTLELKITSNDSIYNLKSIDYHKFHLTEKSILSEIDSISIILQKRGFLNSYVEKLINKDSIYITHYNIGNKTDLIKVFYDSNVIPIDK